MRELMGHAFYGDEMSRLDAGGKSTRESLFRLSPEFRAIAPEQWAMIDEAITLHFQPRDGVFGGQITAGDAYFIALFMAAMRPKAMIEIGVASGYSSAFILTMAEKLGLLSDGPYLFSFDLMRVHAGGQETGSLLFRQFPDLAPFWHLETETTAMTIDAAALRSRLPASDVMAFLDGGHNHPWPAVDLCFLEAEIPQCQWALMQDVQMMERWVADAVIFQAPVPYPVRGAQLALMHWNGPKVAGNGLSYNMAAVKLHEADLGAFVDGVSVYAPEIGDEQAEACLRFMGAKANR